MINNKKILILFLTFFFLLITKTDYRFIENIYCCKDDHDYYIHAETIAIDFDLDYTNQLTGNLKDRFYKEGTSAPSGFIGTGIFSAPFLFVGNILNKLLNQNDNIFNFRILAYSMSSVMYLFFSIFLMNKIMKLLKVKNNLPLITITFLGSGVSYFAFERYSMSHVYEIFSITCIMYFTVRYHLAEKTGKFTFLIALSVLLAILTKWVHLYVLFIPYIVECVSRDRINIKKSIYKDVRYQLSLIFSFIVFCVLSISVYGSLVFNPQVVYETSNVVSSYFSNQNLGDLLISNLKAVLKIFFGQEFGLIWFNPILLIGTIIAFSYMFTTKYNPFFKILILISFSQIFGIVLLWQSTASSYGYRYLLNLVPMSLLLLFTSSYSEKKYILIYLKLFSIFGIIGVVFFEASIGTQLSVDYQLNSFGIERPFVNSKYLSGLFNSVTELDSYLKIFSTSFLGALIFKFILMFIKPDIFIEFLIANNLPGDNIDFQSLLYSVYQIPLFNFLFVSVIYLIICKYIIQKSNIKA